MFKIQTLNNISVAGLDRLPRDLTRSPPRSPIRTPSWCARPRCTTCRSRSTVKAIGRAGAGRQQYPGAGHDRPRHRRVQCPRGQCQCGQGAGDCRHADRRAEHRAGLAFARGLSGDDAAINKAVEAGKKQFVGFELPGRTLGVIGLGAIGVKVANAARALGMKVVGYDPTITVQRAWQLASDVQPAISIDDLLSRSDFVTFHVPLDRRDPPHDQRRAHPRS
jgi:D-3-phosphoglycerate dehydrogenase